MPSPRRMPPLVQLALTLASLIAIITGAYVGLATEPAGRKKPRRAVVRIRSDQLPPGVKGPLTDAA